MEQQIDVSLSLSLSLKSILKRLATLGIDDSVEQRAICTAGGSTNWYNHFEKLSGSVY